MLKKLVSVFAFMTAVIVNVTASPSWDCSNSYWYIDTVPNPDQYGCEFHQLNPVYGVFMYGTVSIAIWDGSAWQSASYCDFQINANSTADAIFELHMGHDYRFTISDGDGNFLGLVYLHDANGSTTPRRFENSSGSPLCP